MIHAELYWIAECNPVHSKFEMDEPEKKMLDSLQPLKEKLPLQSKSEKNEFEPSVIMMSKQKIIIIRLYCFARNCFTCHFIGYPNESESNEVLPDGERRWTNHGPQYDCGKPVRAVVKPLRGSQVHPHSWNEADGTTVDDLMAVGPQASLLSLSNHSNRHVY